MTQAALLPGSGAGGPKRRIPSHDLEELVSNQIRGFLIDPHALSTGLGTTEMEAPIQQSLIVEAKLRSDCWPKTTAVEIRKFLLLTVSRITVKDGSIEILISRQGLIDALLGSPTSRPPQSAYAADNKSNGIPLTVEVRLGRTGNELRLILAAPSSDGPTRDPDLPMLKAIARARDWYEKLIAGEIDSLSTIAKRTGLGARYVSRIFQCAFLAPDIIEAILDGRQPPELTLERLRHPLPIAWDEQRRVLGFPKT